MPSTAPGPASTLVLPELELLDEVVVLLPELLEDVVVLLPELELVDDELLLDDELVDDVGNAPIHGASLNVNSAIVPAPTARANSGFALKARAASLSWRRSLAPNTTLATPGRASAQASAAWAGVAPNRRETRRSFAR